MERHTLASIIVLICINVMDSVMGAIVGPSLIFYVNDLGGSKNEYGMMLSIVFLASIIMIPVYGSWVDYNGNKYIVPYMTSFGLGIVSSVIYFIAIILPKGPIAVYSLMFSRFLDGASIAGRTLSYSWVASTVLPDQQRTVVTFLSMSRTLGMIVGPFVNMLVSEIDTEFQIFGLKIPVDPNNSIGLLMIGGEIVLVVLTLLFLQEPPEKEFQTKRKSETTGAKTEAKGVLYALSHFDIFFPVFIMFVSLANFSLIFTALSPVARNMGWNPVQISEITAYGATVMAFGMVISMFVSMNNIPDIAMISFGIGSFFISGSFIYLLWTEGVGYWQFSLPAYFMYFGYPFIGPANRSKYTKAIQSNKELEGSHGIMMSLINQAAAIAGFIAPTLIASFVLRAQAEIDTSLDKHALTAGSLYVPILCSLVFSGLLYNYFCIDLPNKRQSNNSTGTVSENTTLLSHREKRSPRASIIEISDTFSRSSKAYRRISVEIMGVPNPVETKYEMELNEELLKDKEVWDELEKLDAIES